MAKSAAQLLYGLVLVCFSRGSRSILHMLDSISQSAVDVHGGHAVRGVDRGSHPLPACSLHGLRSLLLLQLNTQSNPLHNYVQAVPQRIQWHHRPLVAGSGMTITIHIPLTTICIKVFSRNIDNDSSGKEQFELNLAVKILETRQKARESGENSEKQITK